MLMGDLFIICISIFLSYLIRILVNHPNPSIESVLLKLSPGQLPIILIHISALYFFDLYNLNQFGNRYKLSILLILSVFAAGLFISGLLFFFPKYIFGRQVLLLHLFILSGLLVLWRLLNYKMSGWIRKTKSLSLVGRQEILLDFIDQLAPLENHGYTVQSVYVTDHPEAAAQDFPSFVKCHVSLTRLIESEDYDILLFDGIDGNFSSEESNMILQVKYRDRAVYDIPTFYKNLTGKIPIKYINSYWLLNNERMLGKKNLPYARFKRLFDIVLSIALIVLLMPLYITIAVLIKLNSKGPVFFVQERLGYYRKPFKCIKFRTMIDGAEKKTGPVWSKENDPRITLCGKVLRKTRLDELPQLFNIIIGDMSFIGPRPIREHFANQLNDIVPFYRFRFNVKPGLSGWAQVNRNYGGSIDGQYDKFQYELFYIQNMSIVLDLLTVIKTTKTMIKASGS